MGTKEKSETAERFKIALGCRLTNYVCRECSYRGTSKCPHYPRKVSPVATPKTARAFTNERLAELWEINEEIAAYNRGE